MNHRSIPPPSVFHVSKESLFPISGYRGGVRVYPLQQQGELCELDRCAAAAATLSGLLGTPLRKRVQQKKRGRSR